MTNLIFEAGDQPQFVFQAYNSTSQKPDLGFACTVVGYRTLRPVEPPGGTMRRWK